MTIAILTAAGTGTRMGQEVPKQFLNVYDKPIIVYTMERFQRHAEIDGIVVVTLPEWMEVVRVYARQFGISKLIAVVPGGATGQESIRNGVEEVARRHPEGATVMIHDGNRTMVDDAIISDSLRVFREHGSAVAVIPCTEVVFKGESPDESTEEIPRELLWRTQTPHTYALAKLQWALDQAKQRGLTGMAAMCQLMCRLGEKTYYSKGSEKNLKLTTLDDIDIFKALLKAEKSAWLKA